MKIRIRRTSTGFWYINCPACRNSYEVASWTYAWDMAKIHIDRHPSYWAWVIAKGAHT
jgi:ribosomal protein L37AE/L43A